MKQIVVLLLFIAGTGKLVAQVNIGDNIEKGYRDFVQQTRSIITKNELSDFAGLGGEKRFFSGKWEKGQITSNTGLSISTKYMFNYDFLDKQLFVLFKDTVIVADNNYVNSFYLEKDGVRHFFTKFSSIDNTNFMESIHFDSTQKTGIQFLKNRTTVLVKGNKNSYMANFSGNYSDDLKEKTDYYLYFPNGTFLKVKLDKKDLSAALEKYNDKTAPFFNSVKKVTEENVKDLLLLLNS